MTLPSTSTRKRRLTVPYAERLDQLQRKSIPEVTQALGQAARKLSSRIGGLSARHLHP